MRSTRWAQKKLLLCKNKQNWSPFCFFTRFRCPQHFYFPPWPTAVPASLVVTIKICNSGLIASVRPIFLPFFTLLWILIHASETTGLDQLTNRCVKLRWQVGLFLNFLQSRGNNRLWLRYRKYTTVFTLCVAVDWVGKTYAGLFRSMHNFPQVKNCLLLTLKSWIDKLLIVNVKQA